VHSALLNTITDLRLPHTWPARCKSLEQSSAERCLSRLSVQTSINFTTEDVQNMPIIYSEYNIVSENLSLVFIQGDGEKVEQIQMHIIWRMHVPVLFCAAL